MSNSVDKLNQLHPKLREAGLAAYVESVRITPIGVHPVIDQTLRTFEESDKLYEQGRTTPGEIVTHAQAGQSYHNYGLALDFHLQINGVDIWDHNNPNWLIVVDIFKQYGFTWGGDFGGSFKDYPHLENKFGYNWRQLLAKYRAGNFIPGTTYIQI